MALWVSFGRAGSIPPSALGSWLVRGMSPAATTGWDGCNTFSHPTNFGALPSSTGSGTQCALEKSVAPGVCRLSSSSSSGRATPQKTSLSVKERYHFTSFLSSKTLLTNKHVAHLQQADCFTLPNAGGPWHMPPLFPWGSLKCPYMQRLS